MSIAIYGGAFNPIGGHHIKIANEVLKYVDKVILLPGYQSLSGKQLLDGKHRLNMCNLAIKNNNNIIVSDFEIKNKLINSPIEIMKSFLNDYLTIYLNDYKNYDKVYFVMGVDNALNIDKWKNKDESLQLMPYCVISRPDYIVPHGAWFLSKPHMYISSIHDDRSSTKARLYKTTDYLDDDVLLYINKHKLY
jgi:nicotinate-nucleotide adenylyltransferase